MEKPKNFFEENLKFLRERIKMTQQELGKASSLTRTKINALESGQTKSPNLEDLVTLADYFKISVDALLRIQLACLSELKLQELEAGNDAYLSGSKIRVLATNVNDVNEDNIEMVPLKAKAGY